MNRSLLSTLLWLVVLLVGCEKKKYPPQLASLSRTQAPIGEDITLNGTQFGEATVQLGGQSVPIKAKTESSLVVTVPRMAVGPTTVRVQNPDGTSDPLPFTVLQPLPQLGGVSPANGLSGTSVTITGDFLDKLKAVRFGTAAAPVAANGTDKQVVVTVPANLSRGPLKLTVETDGGTSQADFIVAATPVLTGFSPKRLIIGDALTITGKNLTDGIVTINGQAVDKARTTVQDDQIRTIVPTAATTGRLTVTVFDKLSATTADSLVIIPAPQLDPTGLSATEGIEGDKLTLTGRNLRDVTEVAFGNVPGVGLKALSDTKLEVTVPKLAESGEVVLRLTSPGGKIESTQKFLVLLAPASLTLETDRAGRGKTVVVTGRHLHRITAAIVGEKNAPIVGRAEGTSLTLTVPADATTGKVTLTNRAGVGTSTRNLTVVLKPVIRSFDQRAEMGSWVVVKGDYLLGAWGFFAVAPNTTPTRAEAQNKNDEELWLKVPTTAADGPIRIWNESGEWTETGNFNVLLVPRIESVKSENNNAEGFVGEKVTLTGQNFDGCTVRFEGSGQNAENAEPPTYTKLVVKIPSDARTGKIRVTNGRLEGLSADAFRIIGKPDITDIAPNRAKAGETLLIKGNNLKRVDAVRIGGEDVPKTAWTENADGTQITLNVPDKGLRGRVYAQNKAGNDEHRGESFVIVRPPVISSVSSMRLPVGGTITIKGDYLFEASVSFGGKYASEYVRPNTDAELIAKIPGDAQDGTLHLENRAGGADRTGFSVQRAPQISDFAPKSGRRSSEVRITGNYFDEVTEVKFNGGGSSPARFTKSNTEIRVTVPEDATTGAICLYSPAGPGCTASYTVELPVPIVDRSRCTPASLVPNSWIILRGSNFNNVSEAWFANTRIPASQFIKVNGDEITLKVPAGIATTSNVRLVNQFGSSSDVNFGSVPTGNGGLNTGNVGTVVNTLPTASISNICVPRYIGYCYNGSGMSFLIEYGSSQCDQSKQYRVNTTDYGSIFWVFEKDYNGSTGNRFSLWLERTPDGQNYTGFTIIKTKEGDVLVGNIIKSGQANSGDIIATSIKTGNTITFCSSFIPTNQGGYNGIICEGRCR